MKVIRAEEMGMCFGVRDALQIAAEVGDPTSVTIHGELVHNQVVNARLATAGFHQSSEQERGCQVDTPLVLITAHGVSNAERARLDAENKRLIDTTCPLVRRVHDAALELASEGRHVLLVGKPGHVEVRGIVEDLQHYDVVAGASEVRRYESSRLGVLSQTTMPPELFDEVAREISKRNALADIRVVDTVCHPTRRRQTAMKDLVRKVDAVVVVGGRNSNNTRRLVEFCRRHNVPSIHIQDSGGLDPQWFDSFETVGLTAGTSTLDETIDEVQLALEQISSVRQETGPTK